MAERPTSGSRGPLKTDIRGSREMEALLKKLGPVAAGRAGDRALRAGAKPIVAAAKRKVHVRSGALRDSIVAVPERRRKGADERVILIGFKPPASRRAHLEEFGTSHSPAHPFMRPALDETHGEALAEMGKPLGEAIEREAVRLAKPGRR